MFKKSSMLLMFLILSNIIPISPITSSDIRVKAENTAIELEMPDAVDGLRAISIKVKVNDGSIRSQANHFDIDTQSFYNVSGWSMPYSDLFIVNYHGEQQLELKAKADYTESAWLGWFKVSFYKVAYLGNFKEYNPSSFNLPAESLYASYIENGSWDVYQKSFIASANKTVNHLPLHIKFVYPSNYPEKFDTDPLFNTGVQLFDGQKLDQYFYESYSINVGEVGRWPTSGIPKINLKKYLDENYGWIFGEVVDYQKNIIDLDKWNATESLTGIYKYNVTDDSTVLGRKDFFWIIYFTILQSTSMNCTLSVHIKRESYTEAGNAYAAMQDAISEAEDIFNNMKLEIDYSNAKPTTLEVTGSGVGINFAIIPISLTDKAITKNLEYYQGIASEIKQYYKEVSYDTLNINIEVIQKDGSWSSINKASNQYNNNADVDFINDAIVAIDSYVDFTKYDYDPINGKGVIAFVTNSDLFGGGSWIYCEYSSGGMFQTQDNVKVDAAYTYEQRFDPQNAKNVIRGLAHEYGHALGKLLITANQNNSKYTRWPLPDEYKMGNVKCYQSLMGESSDKTVEAIHPDGFIKEWLGWLNYKEITINTTFSITPLSKLGLGSYLYRYSFNAPNLNGPNYFLLEARTPTEKYEKEVLGAFLGEKTFLAVYLIQTNQNNEQTIDLIKTFTEKNEFPLPAYSAKFIVESISPDEAKVRLERYLPLGMVGAVLQAAGSPMSAVQDLLNHEIENPITQSDIDLHAYTEDGKGHVGVNYATGVFENTIAGSMVSGDLFNGNEWIYVPKTTKVKFSVTSKDTANFLNEFSSAKKYTDGTDSYSLNLVYIDDKGVEVSKTVSESLKSGAANDVIFALTNGTDGKTSINVALKPSSVKDILDPSTQLGSIKINVKDSSGNSVSGVSITSTSQPSGQPILSGVSGSDGTLSFSNLLSGNYTLQASKSGYVPGTVQVIVAGGVNFNVSVSMPAQSSGGGGGIPGYPIASIFSALLVSILLFYFNKKNQYF